ncbi:MAG TPA: hypothetical protein ENG63_00925 [Candidatus Desulfofervidus auxilii]|uniref:Uncharacterized protein n=1 Tax=Desulfofervidus auxilii TaxID=1621989 RepID=A0A7C0U1N1_DESA2|nr:hypothetical protein [Candidatus Desulfofervidus auxilii]
MNKEEQRKYYAQFKKIDYQIKMWVNKISKLQEKLIDSLDIKKIKIKEYDLPFSKLNFINTISSMYLKGRVGRRLDLIIYHDNIPLSYIQYASPVINSKINQFLKEKYGKINYSTINKKILELSICVSFGILTNYLSGKLAVFTAMSKEIIDLFNQKYGTKIEVLFTTSIYGKSSLYNRVRNLKYLGLTEGYHSILPKKYIREIYQKYKEHYPHRKISKTALADHLIRLYDHLQKDGVKLSFEIPKLRRGVYVCDKFLPLLDNLEYWYNRWFIPRKSRIGKISNFTL